jgi:Dolichyl-phosphate-mannose-protein mannosyltransferase
VPFLAAAAVIAASYGSGRLLTAGGRLVVEDGLRRRLTSFTVGYVFLATFVFVLGYAHAFRRPVLIAVALAGAAAALPFLPGELRAARRAWRAAGWMRRPLAAIAVLLALDVFLASAPPTSGDAIAYHLSAPKEWLGAGRIFPIWWDWNTFQPFTTEFHQALGQALWNGRAAMVTTALLALLSVCAVFGLTRDLAGRRAAIVAALVWVAQGMFVWEATGGFVELALSGFIALSAWHLVSLRRTGRAQDALWAGLAAGAAAGTKYHGLLFVPVFALLALLLVHHRRPLALAMFAAGACVALPW